MIRILPLAVCCALALSACVPALAQPTQNAGQTVPVLPSYATITRTLLAAPLVVDARIRSADRVEDEDAPGLTPGRARFFVEADVQALIRGPDALPARVLYLVDVPLDARGRPPRLRRERVLLFARPIAGQVGQLQLTGIDSQIAWSPEADALVRGVVTEIVARDAPRAIAGVGEAFHVAGSLPGEGETQIFLLTEGGGQISLQVLRRPGERPRWSVSLGDFIDESASVPARDTLLWYRLACGLPPQLPADSLESGDPATARTAREDYALVIRELGPCE